MEKNNIPAEVRNAFNAYMKIDSSIEIRLRTPAEKAIVTRAFNKFIKECVKAGLSYAKVTPVLSMEL